MNVYMKLKNKIMQLKKVTVIQNLARYVRIYKIRTDYYTFNIKYVNINI